MFTRKPRPGSSGWKNSENWADPKSTRIFLDLRVSPGQGILCMVPPIGEIAVNSTSSSVSARWALVFLAAATLVLAGCGRKGGLDLPPTASEQSRAAAAAEDHDRDAAAKGNLFDPSYGMNSDPAASKGTKKSFILDPLLDSR
jgi:predicted small lipoprotein YifL